MLLISFVEGYVFKLFFLVLWGLVPRRHVRGADEQQRDGHALLLARGKHWGKEYSDGESALRSCVLQSFTMMIDHQAVRTYRCSRR